MKKILLILVLVIFILIVGIYFYSVKKCEDSFVNKPFRVDINIASNISNDQLQKISKNIKEKYPNSVLEIVTQEQEISSYLEVKKKDPYYEVYKEQIEKGDGIEINNLFGKIMVYLTQKDIIENGDFVDYLDNEISFTYILSGSVPNLKFEENFDYKILKNTYKKEKIFTWPYYLFNSCRSISNRIDNFDYNFN